MLPEDLVGDDGSERVGHHDAVVRPERLEDPPVHPITHLGIDEVGAELLERPGVDATGEIGREDAHRPGPIGLDPRDQFVAGGRAVGHLGGGAEDVAPEPDPDRPSDLPRLDPIEIHARRPEPVEQ